MNVHRDVGQSGAKADRAGLFAWYADARERRAGTLLAYKLDRITRRGVLGLAEIIDLVDSTGARILTDDGHDSDTPTFRLVAGVLSEVARTERELIASRTKAKQLSDKKKGIWHKLAPFGYVKGANGRLEPDAERAPIVRQMAEWAVNGDSYRTIAGRLTEAGVPTPSAGTKREGTKWQGTGVAKILKNPVLAGWYPTLTEVARDDDGAPVRVTERPILTDSEWLRLCSVLDSRTDDSRRPIIGAEPKSALTGLLICVCGANAVYSKPGPRGKDVHPRFRCGARKQNREACKGFSYRVDLAEQELTSRVIAYVTALEPDSPALTTIAERWLRLNAPAESAERAAARAALDIAERGLEDLMAARYERGEFDDPALMPTFTRLHRRALARVDQARATVAALPEIVDVGGLLDGVLLRESLDTDTVADRRALFRVVLDAVDVVRGSNTWGLVPRWAGAVS